MAAGAIRPGTRAWGAPSSSFRQMDRDVRLAPVTDGKTILSIPFASQIAAKLSVAAKKGNSLAVETAPVMRLRYGLRYAQDWAGAPASSIRPACPRLWLAPRDRTCL